MRKNISIIGGGNLGTAIAEGLLKSGFCHAADITITKRNIKTLKAFAENGVNVISDNKAAVEKSDVVILAIKPYQTEEILKEIKPVVSKDKLIISVVTGVTIQDMEAILGEGFSLIRAMPNTAIALQESMTCICSKNISDADEEYITHLFEQLGKVVLIDEKLMEAATVLAACGTAFALRYIRANIQGGIEIGFDAATASLIAAQTVKGATELLLKKGAHPEAEIDRVTTPKGCTIAGLNEMEHQGFSSSLIRGVVASYQKIAKED